jgi:hypothetical protein
MMKRIVAWLVFTGITLAPTIAMAGFPWVEGR